jgi:RimJ/RimL family protein N-acetyltransferase
MGVMTIAEWEEYFSDKWIIAMMDRKTGVQTFAWIWDMKGPAGERMASGGFIAFREIWGMRAVSRAVRMSADEFIRVFELKVLHGLIRADNSLARRFAQEIGFKEVAVIPNYIVYRGKLIDGVLVSRTRNGRR